MDLGETEKSFLDQVIFPHYVIIYFSILVIYSSSETKFLKYVDDPVDWYVYWAQSFQEE